MTLANEFTLTLAQARSTRARRGRKWDKADAQRIARRLLSGDLTVSFVPSPEQRDWRLLSRTQVAMCESMVRLRNQIEVLLEQAQIKLTSVVSDVLGKSGQRMLNALLQGVVDPEELAALADRRLRASREEGTVDSQAVLIAIGIGWEGRRNVLAVELANRESASSWKVSRSTPVTAPVTAAWRHKPPLS